MNIPAFWKPLHAALIELSSSDSSKSFILEIVDVSAAKFQLLTANSYHGSLSRIVLPPMVVHALCSKVMSANRLTTENRVLKMAYPGYAKILKNVVFNYTKFWHFQEINKIVFFFNFAILKILSNFLRFATKNFEIFKNWSKFRFLFSILWFFFNFVNLQEGYARIRNFTTLTENICAVYDVRRSTVSASGAWDKICNIECRNRSKWSNCSRYWSGFRPLRAIDKRNSATIFAVKSPAGNFTGKSKNGKNGNASIKSCSKNEQNHIIFSRALNRFFSVSQKSRFSRIFILSNLFLEYLSIRTNIQTVTFSNANKMRRYLFLTRKIQILIFLATKKVFSIATFDTNTIKLLW